jgi:predicted transcriptional regulator
MKPCPQCGYCRPAKQTGEQTTLDVVATVTDTPKTIDAIAAEVGRDYMTVAPILRKLRLENKIKRISKRPEGGKRAVYHYVRQLGTDNP